MLQKNMNSIEKEFVKEMTEKLYNNQLATVFRFPVNPEVEGAEGYKDIIEKPMDLGTIKNKLENDKYKDAEEWKKDIMLVWDNAIKFHKNKNQTKWISEVAEYFKEKTTKSLALIPKSEFDLWYIKVLKANRKINKIYTFRAKYCSLIKRNPENEIK